jgi:LysM repeat protein
MPTRQRHVTASHASVKGRCAIDNGRDPTVSRSEGLPGADRVALLSVVLVLGIVGAIGLLVLLTPHRPSSQPSLVVATAAPSVTSPAAASPAVVSSTPSIPPPVATVTRTPTPPPTSTMTRLASATPPPTATATAAASPTTPAATATAVPPTATPVPSPTPAVLIHVVEDGETLASIAARYQVDLADLIALNGLSDPDLIYPGDELYIPSP